MEPNTHDTNRHPSDDDDTLVPYARPRATTDRESRSTDKADSDTLEHATADAFGESDDSDDLDHTSDPADLIDHGDERTDLVVAPDTVARKANVVSGLIRKYPAVALTAMVAVGFLMGRTIARRYT